MSNMNKEYKEARLNNVEGIQLNERTYNLVIGLVVLFGLALNYLMYAAFKAPIIQFTKSHPVIVMIVYLAGALGGSLLVYKSQNPGISLLGFAIIACSMGILLTGLLSLYDPSLIVSALAVTGVVTGVMMLLAVLFPTFFLGLGRVLGVSLLVCIVVELAATLIFRRSVQFMDWIVALVFCGYIGFDWARAQQYPKTLDNAVDSAADIYVDVVNLFIRILEIMGRFKKDD